MTVEPYAECPCGSGKKFKWCCRQLEGDMNRVERLRKSAQLEAALGALDDVAQKSPDNPWVLTTKAATLMDLGRLEEAAEVVRAVLQSHSEHPSALALDGLLQLRLYGPLTAGPVVQRAIEKAGTTSPETCGNLAWLMSQTLLARGDVFPAMEYLRLSFGLNPDVSDDSDLPARLLKSRQVHLLFKDFHRMKSLDDSDDSQAPAGEETGAPERSATTERPDWRDRFEEACLLAERGAWQAAAERFEELVAAAGETAAVWYNLGICRARLGQYGPAAEALRQYGSLETAVYDAVEADALAELLSPARGDETVDSVLLRFPVADLNRLKEALNEADRFLLADEREPDDEDADGRLLSYVVLDRPRRDYRPEMESTEVYDIQGSLRLADGPDSQPVLALEAIDGRTLDELSELLRRVAGESLGEATDREVIGQVPAEALRLRHQWVLPRAIPPDAAYRFLADAWKRHLEEVWLDTPLALLDGKSPREAGSEPATRTGLYAALLLLELDPDCQLYYPDVRPLYELIGVELPEPIGPEELDLEELPLARLHRLDAANLSDEQLATAYGLAHGHAAIRALETLGRELAGRTELSDRFPLGTVCAQLSHIAARRMQLDEALDWIERGRGFDATKAEYAAESCPLWDLNELSVRLLRPDEPEPLTRLLDHLKSDHGDQPEVMKQLTQLLLDMGVITREQLQQPSVQREPALVLPDQPQEEKRIWTPGGEKATPGKPKIWTPGDA